MNNVKIFKQKIENMLKSYGISDYKNEAELLISFVLNIKKTHISLINEITKKQQNKILKMVNARKKHIPLQHIMKYVEFINTKIKVNKNVLIPRNETEQLTDIVIKAINKQENPQLKVLDLCCGSGAIGIAISKNCNAEVYLSDISRKALKVAKHNGKINNANVKFIKSDMFKNINHKFDVIVSNPPYIKSEEIKTLQTEVKKYEPHIALDGDQGGLKFYSIIANNCDEYLNDGGKLYLEFGKGQETEIIKLFENEFEYIETIKDFYDIKRFLYVKKGD